MLARLDSEFVSSFWPMVMRWFTRRRALAAIALTSLVTAGCVRSGTFDESVPLTEAVRRAVTSGTERFPHDEFDRFTQRYVTDEGRFDYASAAKDRGDLDRYLERLADADVSRLASSEVKALLINAYNAYTIDLMLRHYPIDSIRSLSSPWQQEFCGIGGSSVSLDFIEKHLLLVHELFNDPRVHFAVNCASVGCPPLHRGAFTGDQLDRQLDTAVRSALARERWLRVTGTTVELTAIFKWYRDDFVSKRGSISEFLKPYTTGEARRLLDEHGDAALGYQVYDWSINDIEK